MPRSIRGLLVALGATSLVASALLALPSPARACSLAEGIWATLPADGQTLASGSALRLSGSFSLDQVEVEVDLETGSTTLVADDSFPSAGLYSTTYRLEPAPAEGSQVTLRYCPFEDPEQCSGLDAYSWTIGPADEETPGPAADLEFGIYDHQDIDDSGNSCGGSISDLTLYIHASTPSEDGSGSPRLALVEVLDAQSDELHSAILREVEPGGGALDVQASFGEGVLSEPLSESTCVQVTMLDLAGHRSEPVRACAPHHVVADPEQEPDGEPSIPDEPIWEDFADIDAPVGDEGCSCRTEEGEGSPLVPWGLAVGLLGLRRRRRAR